MKKNLILVAAALIIALTIGAFNNAWADSFSSRSNLLLLNPQADNAWTSGWVEIAPGEALSFDHNLGGDPSTYAVELWFYDDETDGYGVNGYAYGGMEAFGGRYGAYWSNLTATSIRVQRNLDDFTADRIRLRIWQPDPPTWDSGWRDIAAGQTLTLTHSLGGDIDDYNIGIRFQNTSGGLGIHQYAMGGMMTGGAVVGGAWLNLTDSTIQAVRFGGDDSMDQVRVMINLADTQPNYDSGWTAVAVDSEMSFEHNLGGNFGEYLVRISARSTQHGVNSLAVGGFYNGLYRGAYWDELTNSSVNVNRYANDIYAQEVRVRIWLPTQTIYLPVILNGSANIELAYDDGEADSDQSHALGSGFAVLLSPQSSAQLITARYYFNGATGTHPVEVHVWDDAQNDLITPFEVTPPAGEGWFDVDLSTYNLTVDDDFYLGFLYAGTEAHYDPSLGVDTDPPLDGRSYEVPWAAFANDYMIRAVLQP